MEKDPEIDWLLERAKNRRDALLVLGLANNDSKFKIGEDAGFSPGNPKSDAERKRNLSAAVSRSSNSPRIQNLLIEFMAWRTDSVMDIAPSQEILKRLTTIARTSTGNTQLNALKFLDDWHRKKGQLWDDDKRSPEYLLDSLFERHNVFWDAVGLAIGPMWGGGNWSPPIHLQKLADLMKGLGANDPVETIEMIRKIRASAYESDEDESRDSTQTGAGAVGGVARSGGSAADIDGASIPLGERPRATVIVDGGS